MKKSYMPLALIIIVILAVALLISLLRPTVEDQTPAGSAPTDQSGSQAASSGTNAPVSGAAKAPSSSGSGASSPQVVPTYASSSPDQTIHIEQPPTHTTVTSPLTITGEAVGSKWYYEGTFPVELVNSKGTVIAKGTVRAQSDWTSTSFVSFLGTLSFPRQTTGSAGKLIFMSDNPSGLPQNQRSVETIVTFE